MKKFSVLLRKELRELMTIGTLFPIIISMLVFMLIGQFMSSEISKASAMPSVGVVDADKSEFSASMITMMKDIGMEVQTLEKDEPAAMFDKTAGSDISVIIEIPEGMGKIIENDKKPAELKTYTRVSSNSMVSSSGGAAVSGIIASINEAVSNSLIAGSGGGDPEFLKHPIRTDEFTVIGDKVSNISASAISGYMTTQTSFLPIIVFLIIMLASQMLVGTISTEKSDKTFETLLSAPVGRFGIIFAKMLSAGLVSLVYSLFYLFGYSAMMNSITKGASNAELLAAAQELGITLGPVQYAAIGVQLFLSILIGLTVSIIVGCLSEDAKKAQVYIAPLNFLIMIPYFVTLLTDVNTLALPVKIIVNLIPFTHTFTAATNSLLQNHGMLFFGAIYQVIVLAICCFAAIRIIRSDLIFTISGTGMKRKKKKAQPEEA